MIANFDDNCQSIAKFVSEKWVAKHIDNLLLIQQLGKISVHTYYQWPENRSPKMLVNCQSFLSFSMANLAQNNNLIYIYCIHSMLKNVSNIKSK